MLEFETLKKLIEKYNSFLITTHVNPDADAIGSEIALYLLLEKLSKKSYIINHSPTPYNLVFLDLRNVVEKFNAEKHTDIIKNVEASFFLDLNHIDRIVKMKKLVSSCNMTKICIDHHQEPGEFADYFFTDTNATSTGEILYDFIKETKIVELDKQLADPIYAAIMTDTGSFRFDRTTERTHLIAADLLKHGVNPNEIYDKLYDQSRVGKIKLLGEALKTMQLDESGKIAHMIITQQKLKETGAIEAEVDGFVNFCLSIEGVEIGILFFELRDGMKISFRSKGSIAINKLAAEFGGGGHLNAAGTRLFNVARNEFIPKVLDAAKRFIPK